MTREEAIALARTAALNYQQRAAYPYLPVDEAQAANWMPHGWAIEAIMQASAPTEFKFEPTTWEQRLRAEYDDLCVRLGKLETFLTTETFNVLPVESQTLLVKQAGVMRELGDILAERIAQIPA